MSDSSQGPIVLPVSTIQNDFQDVIRDVLDGTVPDEKFWISCYKFGEPSVHGKAIVTLDENDRNLLTFQGQDGVEMKDYGDVSHVIVKWLLSLSAKRRIEFRKHLLSHVHLWTSEKLAWRFLRLPTRPQMRFDK